LPLVTVDNFSSLKTFLALGVPKIQSSLFQILTKRQLLARPISAQPHAFFFISYFLSYANPCGTKPKDTNGRHLSSGVKKHAAPTRSIFTSQKHYDTVYTKNNNNTWNANNYTIHGLDSDIGSVSTEIIDDKPALGQVSCFEPAQQLHTPLIFQGTRVSLGITELFATAHRSVFY